MGILSDAKIKSLKYSGKPSKHTDGDGMFVHITATKSGGVSKHFRYNFLLAGKSKQISYGSYPEVSLGKARERHLEAKALLSDGINPVQHRRQQRAEQAIAGITLKEVSEEFFTSKSEWAARTLKSETLRAKNHVVNTSRKFPSCAN